MKVTRKVSAHTPKGLQNRSVVFQALTPAEAPPNNEYTQDVDGALDTAGALIKQARVFRAGASSFAGAVVRQGQKILTAALSTAGAIVTQISSLQVGELDTAGALIKGRFFTGSMDSGADIIRSSGKLLVSSSSYVGSMLRDTSYAVAGVLDFVGVLIKGRFFTGSMDPAGGVIKSTDYHLTSGSSFAGALLRGRMLTGALTTAASLLYGRILTGALGLAGALIKASSVSRDGVLSFTGVILKQFNSTLTAALTLAAALMKSSGLLVSGAITPAAALVGIKITLKSLAASIDTAAELVLQAQPNLAAVLSFVGTPLKSTSKLLTGASDFVGDFVARANKALSGALSSAGVVIQSNAFIQGLTAELEFVGSILKSTTSPLAGVSSFVGSPLKQATRTFTGALNYSAAVIRSASKGFSGAITPAGVVLPGFVFSASLAAGLSTSGAVLGNILGGLFKVLTGAITPAATLTKRPRVSFAAVLDIAGAFTKLPRKALAGVLGLGSVGAAVRGLNLQAAISFSATAAGVKFAATKFLSLASLWSGSGSIVKRTGKRVSGNASYSSLIDVLKLLSKTFNGSISFLGTAPRRMSKILSASATFIGTIPQVGAALSRTLTAALSFSGTNTQKKVFNRALTAAITFVGTFEKDILKRFVGFLNMTASGLVKGINLQGALSTSGFLDRAFSNLFQSVGGAIGFVGVSGKRAGKTLIGFLNGTSVGKFKGRFNVGVLGFSGVVSRLRVVPVSFTGALSISGVILRFHSRMINAILSYSGQMVKLPRRMLNSNLSFFGTALRGDIYTMLIAGSTTMVGAMNAIVGSARFLSVSSVVGFSGMITKTWTFRIFGALSASSTLMRNIFTVTEGVIGYSAIVETLGLGRAKFIDGVVGLSGELTKVSNHLMFSFLLIQGGTLNAVKVKTQALAAALSFTALADGVKARAISLVGSLTVITGVVRKRVNLSNTAIVGSFTFLGKVSVGKSLVGALSSAGSMVAKYVFTRNLVAAINMTGVFAKSARKVLSGAISPTSLQLIRARLVSGLLVLVGAFDAKKVKLLSLAGQITSSGAMTKRANKVLAGVISFSSICTRSFGKVFTGSIAFIGDLVTAANFRIGLSVDGSMDFASNNSFHISKLVSSAVTYAGSLAKQIRTRLSVDLSFSSTVTTVRLVIKFIESELSFAGATRHMIIKVLDATQSLMGLLEKHTTKTFVAVQSFVGSMQPFSLRLISFVSSIGFVGALTRLPIKQLLASISPADDIYKIISVARNGALSFSAYAARRIPFYLTSAVGFTSTIVGTYLVLVKSVVAQFRFFKPSISTATEIKSSQPTINTIKTSVPTVIDIKWSE